MTITLKVEKRETTTHEVEVSIPCFWRNKSGTEFLGVLDEKNIVSIISDDWENSICNFRSENLSVGSNRIKNAVENFQSCTESEFLDKLSEVERSMPLRQILIP